MNIPVQKRLGLGISSTIITIITIVTIVTIISIICLAIISNPILVLVPALVLVYVLSIGSCRIE